MISLVVDNTLRAELSTQFFNKTPASGSRLSKVAHEKRLDWLKSVNKEVEKIPPAQATPEDIAVLIAVLICAGLPQARLAEVLQVSKTTIGRWLDMEAPPRPISRQVIIERCKILLGEVVAAAA